jgi:hypothetical protein
VGNFLIINDMTKTRKNFNLDTKIVKASARCAKKSKRSLTAHIELLMQIDAIKEGELKV